MNVTTKTAFVKNDTLWVNFETSKEQNVKNFEVSARYFHDDFKIIEIIPSQSINGNSVTPLSYAGFTPIKNGIIVSLSLAVVCLTFCGLAFFKKSSVWNCSMAISLFFITFSSCTLSDKADALYHQNKRRVFISIKCNFLNGTSTVLKEFEAVIK